MSLTVAQILRSKPDSGRTIHMVEKSDSVYNAIKLMAEKSIGALLVMDGANIAGIVTERDYARRWYSSTVRRKRHASRKS